MPEFNFALTDREIEETLDYIFELGGYVQKGYFYSELDRYIFSKDDMKKYFDSQLTHKLYIFHKESFVCPMPIHASMRNGEMVFYPNDRIGGPAIILAYFKTVNKGFGFYYPTYYYDNKDYISFKPAEALVVFYKALFKFIRKKSVIIKYYNRRIYCGREYIREVMEGTAKFEIKDEFKAAIMEQMKGRFLKEK